MNTQLALAAVVLPGLSCSGHSALGTAPSPVDVKANATTDISSLHVITPGAEHILASFSLLGTGGRSGATQPVLG